MRQIFKPWRKYFSKAWETIGFLGGGALAAIAALILAKLVSFFANVLFGASLFSEGIDYISKGAAILGFIIYSVDSGKDYWRSLRGG